MSLAPFLAELNASGIVLSVDSGRLTVRSRDRRVPDALVHELRERKEEILAYLERRNIGPALARLSPEDRCKGVPISLQQRSLWWYYQGEHSSRYNVSLQFVIRGDLDAERLQHAIAEVYRTHPSLHACFEERDGQVLMRSALDPSWRVQEHDALDSSAVDHWVKHDREYCFDPCGGPVFIARLLRLGGGEGWRLHLTLPHLVIDGWSMGQLWAEIVEAYHAGSAVPVEFDFMDHLGAQRDGDDQVYWERRLAGYEPVVLHSAGEPDGEAPFVLNSRLSAAQSRCLEALARASDVSGFCAAYACFGQVMAHYLGHADLVVSVPFANRSEPHLARALGHMVSVLPVRFDFAGAVSKLAELQTLLHADMASPEVDIAALLRGHGPDAEAHTHPLQSLVFSWQEGIVEPVAPAGTEVTRLPTLQAGPKFPLMLTVSAEDGGHALKWEYDPSRLSASTVRLLERRFVALLAGGELGADEPRAWGDIEVLPVADTVVSRFANTVRANAEAVALQHGERCLSYGELDLQSTRVAAGLQARGVQVGERVGVCLPRGIELVGAILGVLKAGGVYVLLDISTGPAEAVVDACRMRICIGEATDGAGAVPIIGFDELAAADAVHHTPVKLSSKAAAYVGFTSGLSGAPRGIECTHRGVLRLAVESGCMEFGPHTCMLGAAPVSLDSFTLEIWGALLNGGTLCLLEASRLDNRELQSIVRERGVNTAYLTSALFNALVDVNVDDFVGLRQLLVGGDIVSPRHVRKLYEHDASIGLVNVYAPAGTTAFACCFPIPRDWSPKRALPLGAPVRGSGVLVLDTAGRPLPAGCVGEIATSGSGLALGYLEPADDHGRFAEVEHDGKMLRVHRSADVGFVDIEGQVVLLGRLDRQARVHGRLVELAAINHMLCEQPGVRTAETLVVNDAEAASLASFVQWEGDADVERLRAVLALQLPGYMQPADLVTIERVPLTANGQLDRAFLERLLVEHRTRSASMPARALSATERTIAAAWCELLGCEAPGPDANFYAMGGSSLALLRLRRRLESEFGGKPNLRRLLAASTLAQQAQVLEHATGEADSAPGAGKIIAGADDLIFATNEQQRLWLIQQSTDNSAYNIPLAIRVADAIDEATVRAGLLEVFAALAVLRSRFAEDGERLLVETLSPEQCAIDVEDIDAEDLTDRLEREGARRFDLARGVCIATILRLRGGGLALLLNIHHSCFDGASLPPLLEALDRALSGRPIPEATPFSHYARWQACDEAASASRAAARYWIDALSGVREATRLPPDRNTASLRGRAARVERSMQGAVVDGVRLLAASLGVSEFCGWLAVVALAVGRLSATARPVIAIVAENRPCSEFERTVGFFANTLLFDSGVSEDATVQQGIMTLQARLQSALEHQSASLADVLGGLGRLAGGVEQLTQVAFSYSPRLDIGQFSNLCSIDVGRSRGTKFPIAICLAASAHGYEWQIDYDASMYSDALVATLADVLCSLARAIATEPERRVVELKLPAYEGDIRSTGELVAIPRAIWQRAQSTPGLPALQTRNETLSYSDLVRRASAYADVLRSRGVQRGARVAVLMERGIDLPIVLLATMWCGATYVPLDPAYPPSRVDHILADAEPQLLVHDAAGAGRLFGNVLSIEQMQAAPLTAAASEPAVVSDHDIAYVIYTSGSTGVPKGVPIGHLNVAALAAWARTWFSPEDVQLVYAGTSVCFDLSVFELFVTWSMGGTVFFAGNTLALLEDVETHPITLINSVPSVLREIMTDLVLPPTVRVVNAAGEPLPADLATMLRRQPGHPRVVNLYGPTEDTVYSTAWEVPAGPVERILIGRPLPGTVGRVLDARDRDVPTCFPGELALGGVGLGPGYWRRDDLNASRFFLHPADGLRYFRTGDVVRRLPDGNLEYLGRNDHQVKIDGHRIELLEIEAVAAACEGVDDACANVITAKDGRPKLVCHIASSRTVSPCAKQIRQRLRDHLPYYMQPRELHIVDRFPLTPSGKKDRRAIATMRDLSANVPPSKPDSWQGRDEAPPPVTSPARPVEAVIERVFGLAPRQAAGSLADLGVSSLRAVALVRELNSEFGLALTVTDVIRASTVEDILRLVTGEPAPVAVNSGVDPSPLAWFSTLDELAERHSAGTLQVVLSTASGELSYARSIKRDRPAVDVAESTMRIGCNFKLITALVCLRLVEEGRLALGEPVRRYLAGTSFDVEALDGIELRHLLGHSHGIDAEPGPEPFRHSETLATLVSQLPPVSTRLFRPGSMFAYGNLGYVLAARVAEAATNSDFGDLVRRCVEAPLRIELDYRDQGAPPRPEDVGESVRGGVASSCLGNPVQRALMPAGSTGVGLTARALSRVARSFVPRKAGGTGLIGDALLLRVYESATPVDAYPYVTECGLALFRFRNDRWGNIGQADGHHSLVMLDPSRGIVLACIAARYPSLALFDELATRLFGNSIFAAHVGPGPIELPDIRGNYANVRHRVRVESDATGLALAVTQVDYRGQRERCVNHTLQRIEAGTHRYAVDGDVDRQATFFRNGEGTFLRLGQLLMKRH